MGCDAVCIGSMTSASSALALIGAPLIGSISDRFGRRFALIIGCIASAFSSSILGMTNSLLGIWLAIIPQALLSHNFAVSKALVADLSDVDRRAGAMGMIGVGAGLGFMLGPGLSKLISTFEQAIVLSICLQLSTLVVITMLPAAQATVGKPNGAEHGEKAQSLQRYLRIWYELILHTIALMWAAKPAAKMLLFMKFCMSICFHVFNVYSQMILKDRFQFGPGDYGSYFSVIGVCYAGNQLFCAGPAIRKAGDDPTRIMALCVFVLGLGRLFYALSASIAQLYASMVLTIQGLGVLNTAISTLATRISGSEKDTGALMGLLDAAEKFGGVTGPTLGGLLYALTPLAPAGFCISFYFGLSGLLLWLSPRFLVPGIIHGNGNQCCATGLAEQSNGHCEIDQKKTD